MKIPIILATSEIPSELPHQRVPLVDYAAGGAAVAGALAHTAQTITDVQQRQYRQGVHVESDTLKSRMDIFAGTNIADLQTTERDPDGYLTKSQTAIQDAYDQAVQQAKYPETKAILQQHMVHLQATKGVEAQKYSNQLYTQRNEGLRDEGLDNLRILGSTAPDTARMEGTPEPGTATMTRGAGDYLVAGLKLINDATPNEKQAADLRVKFKNDFLETRGMRDIEQHPTMDLSQYRSVLAPEKYRALVGHQDLVQRQVTAAEDRSQRRLDREISQQRVEGFARITDNVLKGSQEGGVPMTENDARSDPAWTYLEGGQREHIVTMIREPKPQASNPVVRANMVNSVMVQRPLWTEDQILALHKVGGLNDADTTLALQHIRQRADYYQGLGKSDAHRAEDQQRHVWEREQGYIDHTMDTALSLTGSIAERLDPKSQELKAIARDTMFKESRTFRGTRDPEEIMHEILPDLMIRLADGPDGVRNDYGKMQRIIELGPYKTKQDLLNAKGRIPDAEFYKWAEAIKNRDDAQRTYEQLQDSIRRLQEAARKKAK